MDNIICDNYMCLLFKKEHPMNQHILYKSKLLYKKCEYETCNCFVVGKEKYCQKHLPSLYNNELFPFTKFNSPISQERILDNKNMEKNMYDHNIELIRKQLESTNLNNKTTKEHYNVPPPSPC
jgi:hypothetical protein